MKKLSVILAVVACLGLFLGACSSDSGPTCKKIVTCDPVCDIMASQWCCGTTCQDIATCDPACAADTEYCDPCGGGCKAVPADCDPACAATEYCDNGTCKTTPVCSPVCANDEYCSN